jgi:hypothetical protein
VAEKRERQMTGLHCFTEAYEKKSDPLGITSKNYSTVFRRNLFYYALFAR